MSKLRLTEIQDALEEYLSLNTKDNNYNSATIANLAKAIDRISKAREREDRIGSYMLQNNTIEILDISNNLPPEEEFKNLSFTDKLMYEAHFEMYVIIKVLTEDMGEVSKAALNGNVYSKHIRNLHMELFRRFYCSAWEPLEEVGGYTKVKVTVRPKALDKEVDNV